MSTPGQGWVRAAFTMRVGRAFFAMALLRLMGPICAISNATSRAVNWLNMPTCSTDRCLNMDCKGFTCQNGRCTTIDINECLENNGNCLGFECVNSNGSFACLPAFNSKTCQVNNGGCGNQSVCANTLNGVWCHCPMAASTGNCSGYYGSPCIVTPTSCSTGYVYANNSYLSMVILGGLQENNRSVDTLLQGDLLTNFSTIGNFNFKNPVGGGGVFFLGGGGGGGGEELFRKSIFTLPWLIYAVFRKNRVVSFYYKDYCIKVIYIYT